MLRALFSAVLTAATLGSIYGVNSDVLLFPGYLVAWLFYPGGVHDGHGRAWLLVGTVGNIVFYALLWMGILSLVSFPRDRAKSA